MAKVKAITKLDDMGLFIDKTDEVLVDSRFVAEAFDKPHRSVLRDIRNILGTESEKVAEFNLHNFVQMSYTDSVGRKFFQKLLDKSARMWYNGSIGWGAYA